MAEIYSAPSEVKIPSLDFDKVQDYTKDSERYIKELTNHIKDMGYKGKKKSNQPTPDSEQ